MKPGNRLSGSSWRLSSPPKWPNQSLRPVYFVPERQADNLPSSSASLRMSGIHGLIGVIG
jgi:hypothetical protein